MYGVTIQLLHYEFLGPVALDKWGPPMTKVVYAILAREKDLFHLAYIGICEDTDEPSFFVSNTAFKCWIDKAASEQNLYLAILPMFNSDAMGRKHVCDRLVSVLKPPCNKGDTP